LRFGDQVQYRPKTFYRISVAANSTNLAIEDDGLAVPEVGSWAETKYRLLGLYDELFATGMKFKWDQRVYIDLYAGAGYSRVKGTRRFLKGSPILALTVAQPFDKYIFCEDDNDLLDALKARVARIAPQVQAAYILGSCDSEIDDICKEIPRGSSKMKVLSLCVVDPFDFGLKFQTLKRRHFMWILWCFWR
jgi:three-Cys-motif partner protein